MENIRIVVTDNNTITVRADTKRFGKDAIMYEDHKFMNCFDYIRRATKQDHFKVKHLAFVEPFTDTDGLTMGRSMWIELPA